MGGNAFMNGHADFQQKYSELKLRGLAASVIFYTPVLKEIYTYMGVVDASRATAEWLLANDYSLFVFPGGIKEQIFTKTNGKYELHLTGLKHAGAVRLALKFGKPLVPAFVFGVPYWFRPIPGAYKIGKFLFENFRMGLPLCYGKFFSPFIPIMDEPLTVVVGKPLEFPKVPNPTEEQILHYQDIYIAEIKAIFEKYKEKYSNREDEILIL
eukprot:TRINITY_DN1583_c0_g1_i16.p1 TRINITY_DN1583_c0_g1~~TRINITY_DN1583_c0_g1_i16.p1  ORF type:complete len:211 (-),score=36.17 TRINITY_DN1583_c0_g1_i16:176-808(-)